MDIKTLCNKFKSVASIKNLFTFIFFSGVAFTTNLAFAEGVRVIADNNLACIEIRKGRSSNPLQYSVVKTARNVKRDDILYITDDSDRVCYRRSPDPDKCNGQWAGFHCTSWILSGRTDLNAR